MIPTQEMVPVQQVEIAPDYGAVPMQYIRVAPNLPIHQVGMAQHPEIVPIK